jgi:hypothetical protein
MRPPGRWVDPKDFTKQSGPALPQMALGDQIETGWSIAKNNGAIYSAARRQIWRKDFCLLAGQVRSPVCRGGCGGTSNVARSLLGRPPGTRLASGEPVS